MLWYKYRIQFISIATSSGGFMNLIGPSVEDVKAIFLKHCDIKDVKIVDIKKIGVVPIDDGPGTVGQLDLKVNGSIVGSYTGTATSIDIPVPKKTSQLTNDSGFVDSSAIAGLEDAVVQAVLNELEPVIEKKENKATSFSDDDAGDDTHYPTVGAVIRYIDECVMTEDQIKDIINKYSLVNNHND